jgi:formiminoglutamase
MEHLKLLTPTELDSIVIKRPNETKFGEHIQLVPSSDSIYDEILNLDVSYVIFGIQEDIGVFANNGKQGTYNAWPVVLNSLLNIQSNKFLKAKGTAILGCLDYSHLQEKIGGLDQNNPKHLAKARRKVDEIDKDVAFLVSQIVKAGKVPIIIGGGHNNAYGCIKGTALAIGESINALNFDAHTDFRAEEGRHSGNGFSYAYAEGFLNKYFIFGLHENYTSNNILKTIKRIKSIDFNTYDEVRVRKEKSFNSELKHALAHVNNQTYGIEIDLDAVRHINSSAQTPSGYSSDKVRRFLNFTAQNSNVGYLHICEGIPDTHNEALLGKFISYLITDFLKAHSTSKS